MCVNAVPVSHLIKTHSVLPCQNRFPSHLALTSWDVWAGLLPPELCSVPWDFSHVFVTVSNNNEHKYLHIYYEQQFISEYYTTEGASQKMLEFEQLKWDWDYFCALLLHRWQPCDVKVKTLLFCPLWLALALGGSGDSGFYAHRTGSGPCSHWDEKAPPCSPHVRWAAFSWADEGVWEGFSQCQEGKAVAFVSLSTTLKGVGVTQIACIRFAPWDYCRHFPRETFCIC